MSPSIDLLLKEALEQFPQISLAVLFGSAALGRGCVKTPNKMERKKIDPPERSVFDLFDVGYGFDTPKNRP